MVRKTESNNNDDYEFRIVSSTISPLTNEGIFLYYILKIYFYFKK